MKSEEYKKLSIAEFTKAAGRYESGLLYDAINRAKTLYFENRKSWDDMVIRDMNKDVSWEKSAKQYKDMYVGLTPRD